MRKFVLIILFIISINKIYSQRIQDVVTLDTIVTTSLILENSWEKVTSTIYDNKIWMYTPLWNGNDSVMFVRYDVSTFKSDTLIAFAPNLFLRIKDPRAKTLSINQKYCVLTFTNAMLIFNNKSNHFEFNKIFPLNESYSFSKLNDNLLICGKAYNYHPLDETNKTSLTIYDLKKDSFLYYINPVFKDIEFSHFGGNHWIDNCKDQILFAQTTEYSIDIYNSKLEKAEKIDRKKIGNWKNYDTKITERLNEKIPPEYVKELIDSLLPYHKTVSRVEGAYFINDSTIFVRYIPANSEKNHNQRMYDIWRNKNKSWQLLYSDLKDEDLFQGSETITVQNYSVEGYAYDTYFYGNLLIQIRPGTNIYPIGKNLKKYNQDKDTFFIRNNPIATIVIFKIHL